MPCYDDRDSPQNVAREYRDEIQKLKGTIDRRNAMLCSIFKAAMKHGGVEALLSNLDYEECGITKSDFQIWWNKHQAEDNARLMKEANARDVIQDARDKAQAKRNLIKKLTTEEQSLLGL